jgi:MFS family permease
MVLTPFPDETRAAVAAPMNAVRPIHGVLLVMGAWCTVLAAGALAPVLPQIRDHFIGTPRLDLMIGFVATMPSLAVALFAVPLGRLADRIGLARVLLAGLLLYGVAGVMPFWLDALGPIIALRFVVGVGEAAVMTASTAMIGLLFSGAVRARWLGIQVAAANFLGIAVLLSSGYLGLAGWHAPFLIYSFALVLLVPCLFVLPRPRPTHANLPKSARPAWTPQLKRLLAESCGLIFLGTIALFVIIVQFGFILVERGAADSGQIGLGLALAATGIALGATSGGLLARWTALLRLRIAFGLIGGGFVAMMMVDGLVATIASGAIAGFGSGLVIPVLLSRLLGATPPALMGSVTGVWIAATFVGQFANPPLFILLRAIGGTQAVAIGLFGGTCLMVVALLSLVMRNTPEIRPFDFA